MAGIEMKKMVETLYERDVSRDTFLSIILLMQSEEMAKVMNDWLCLNPKATQRRIIQHALRLNRSR